MKIPGLRDLHAGRLLANAVKAFIDDDMRTYASALAYQILFSLFLFFFLLALISTLHLSNFIYWMRQQAQMLLPEEAVTSVNSVLDLLCQPRDSLLSAGAIVPLWTASAGVRATMNAFRAAYCVKETRRVWVRDPLSIFYTLAVAVLLILPAALLLIGPRVMQWMADYLGFEPFFVTAWTWVCWPAAIVLLSLSAALVDQSAPAAQPKFPFVTPGTVLPVLLSVMASIGCVS